MNVKKFVSFTRCVKSFWNFETDLEIQCNHEIV